MRIILFAVALTAALMAGCSFPDPNGPPKGIAVDFRKCQPHAAWHPGYPAQKSAPDYWTVYTDHATFASTTLDIMRGGLKCQVHFDKPVKEAHVFFTGGDAVLFETPVNTSDLGVGVLVFEDAAKAGVGYSNTMGGVEVGLAHHRRDVTAADGSSAVEAFRVGPASLDATFAKPIQDMGLVVWVEEPWVASRATVKFNPVLVDPIG